MDANKLKKLKEINYEITPSCGMCKFSQFAGTIDFGTCSLHTYEHLKHSDSKRELSIYRYGSCHFFIASEYKISQVQHFKDLFRVGLQ